MELLEQEGLFGKGLVSVHTPELTERYNACLKDIGIEPTGLEKFSVDGMGWSPEIAAEKRDNFYLSHGGANQFAIILTPRQYKKPLYFPFYSFSRYLMKEVFDRHMRQIADITRDTAIWLDIDQEISHYLNPLDLLLLDSIEVHVFTASRIMRAAKRQRLLIRQFTNEDDAWFDAELRSKIIESAKTHGDLRDRSLLIPKIPFNGTRSFYSMAFDGVYIIRDVLRKTGHMLILEDDERVRALGEDVKGVFCLSDPSLATTLIYEGLARIDTLWYKRNPDILDLKIECLFVDVLSEHYPDVAYDELTSGQKRGFVRQLRDRLPEAFFELERLAKQITNGNLSFFSRSSQQTTRILMYPNPDLPEPVQEVVWQLITEITPLDVVALYTYNRSRFFDLYQTWPPAKKRWAAKMIRRHYVPRMNE